MPVSPNVFAPAPTKLLSFCIASRDDDYMPDIRYRLTMTLDCLGKALLRLDRADEVEVVIVDFGGEQALHEVLDLSPEAVRISRFIRVPPDLVRSLHQGRNDFNSSLSLNIGVRRARGQYVMQYASDHLMTQVGLETLLRFLSGDIPTPVDPARAILLPSRLHLPWQLVERQPRLEEWERYLLLGTSELNHPHPESHLAIFSGAGAFLMHAHLWHEAGGLDERFAGWGFSDHDIGFRLSQAYP